MEPSRVGKRRLGVGHLLVWMAGCGIVLAIFRSMPDGQTSLHADATWARIAGDRKRLLRLRKDDEPCEERRYEATP